MKKLKELMMTLVLYAPIIIILLFVIAGIAQSVHYAFTDHPPTTTIDYMQLVAKLSADDHDEYEEDLYTYDDIPMTVYVVETGKKYHYNSDCSNMKYPRALSIDEASDEGYTPCRKCFN